MALKPKHLPENFFSAFMTDIENNIGANLKERKWDSLNEDIWRI